ncbi:DUF2752 domain-containing protein [Pedobacter sandarakinus]|uniref:DUF2752 domain-containing protein n=1 Tax=Pedobacter sandarakinus TaxID=353156 RepID=UPI0022460A55|nr:DUF2752 domain-containing protein [Pedobacter sandarakinus]MCX2573732.1 DUF2752 domain-containing protein [Pedobacter sandarakinus]
MKHLKQIPLELIFWVLALVLLATANGHEHHFTICPLANLGFEQWCPGCGLGRAISHIFHGEFAESFAAHWFGFPALLIIVYRIYNLTIDQNKFKKLTTNT